VFCGEECFKASWKAHQRRVHKPRQERIDRASRDQSAREGGAIERMGSRDEDGMSGAAAGAGAEESSAVSGAKSWLGSWF
jgi:hypothetical protein